MTHEELEDLGVKELASRVMSLEVGRQQLLTQLANAKEHLQLARSVPQPVDTAMLAQQLANIDARLKFISSVLREKTDFVDAPHPGVLRRLFPRLFLAPVKKLDP